MYHKSEWEKEQTRKKKEEEEKKNREKKLRNDLIAAMEIAVEKAPLVFSDEQEEQAR